VPPLGERVELREQRRLERSLAPAALQLTGKLLGPAPVGEACLLPSCLPPDLRCLLRIDRDEDARISTGRKLAEDAAVEAVLGLRDEVEDIVRQPVVVTGRRPHEQVGRPVTFDVDVVPALLLGEPNAHQPLRFNFPCFFA
jgi:hypothetical protein